MTFFSSLYKKLDNWENSQNNSFKISGCKPEQWVFILSFILQVKKKKNHLLICPDTETAEQIYSISLSLFLDFKIMFYSGMEVSPYGGILPPESNLTTRLKLLDQIVSDRSPKIIILSREALMLKMPPASFFEKNFLEIYIGYTLSPEKLAAALINIGYSSSITVEESGTFSKKGEIFDIHPISHPPIRLHYFDNTIEEIFFIDQATYRTDKKRKITGKIRIGVGGQIFTQRKLVSNLRKNLPRAKIGKKKYLTWRDRIFTDLAQGILFENYVIFISLFFNNPQSILKFLKRDETWIHFFESKDNFSLKNQLEEEYFETWEYDQLPSPESLYHFNYRNDLEEFKNLRVEESKLDNAHSEFLDYTMGFNLQPIRDFIGKLNLTGLSQTQEMLNFISNFFRREGHIFFSYYNEALKEEIGHFLQIEHFDEIRSRIHFIKSSIEHGFYDIEQKLIFLGNEDLFRRKKQKTKNITRKKIDLFAEQLISLSKNDFIIHKVYGLGKFLGLKSLETDGNKTDYMVIGYQEGDKVYVPVYKMDQVQKHADADAGLALDNLRKNKYRLAKQKASRAAKKLAFDLIKLQADRHCAKAYAFSPPDHLYREFENTFPFQETPDQIHAIENVLDDMQKEIPMDRLICGDVGFGKTEVAIRAAFKAVIDGKQVAVLVPTTLLSLQHYNTFKKRFEKFPIVINFLSRIKSLAEEKKIKKQLAEGQIDIIIGTQKLLSTSISFNDLGLIIIDEEHRFGVNHKERLKLLKLSVDCLTLTATPIPRTLQLAFLGLRDISVIKTAPPHRQSIKTYLIKEDMKTVCQALKKEIDRGGQAFIVYNRVAGMEIYKDKIQKLVPQARIIYAHGKLSKQTLEKRMTDFYDGNYQILITTTIIESGLDIPNANTIIINHADTYGLAQLHQLRGRVGRGPRKAYAYLMISENKEIGKTAQKRLQALQNYEETGAGFSLAISDLEIRGAGDILGAFQSGHMQSIGMETYMELLQDAINELKGKPKKIKRNIEINTPFEVLIPSSFISDTGEKFKQYKRLASCDSLDILMEQKQELIDIYGNLPIEMENLFSLLEIRLRLQYCGIEALWVTERSITVKFDKNALKEDEKLQERIHKSMLAKNYQFTPDYGIVYHSEKVITKEDLLTFSCDIAQQIVPC